MFAYIGIAYACLLDQVAFDTTLNWLEWLGVGIILLTVLSLTLHLINNQKEKKDVRQSLIKGKC